MPAKKKTGGTRRERTIHEVRGTISDMLKGGKSSSGYIESDEEMDSLERASKNASNLIEHKIAAAYKIKKMEQAGIFSRKAIEEAKRELGILDEGEPVATQEGSYNIISTQIANAPDPETRERLSQQMMIMDVYKQLKGRPMHEIQAAVNNLKMSFIQATPKKDEKAEDFKDKLLLKFIDKNMGEPKSELDNLDKLTSLIDKVQKLTPQSDSLKEMSQNIKAYKELGLIKDPATSIEESKLEVEKLKINKEYEIKKEEIDSDKQRTKSLADIGGDVLSSAFEAFGAATSKGDGKGVSRSNPAVRQETLQNAMNATCVTPGCEAKILVTNIDQSREIKCGGCGQQYVFDANQKKLFVAGVEQPGPETSGPAPGTNQDTSQSSTA